MNNTKKQGTANIFIFPDGKKYTAVCLDFNIIEEATTLELAEKQIVEAVKGYIINVCKNNLDNKLLNRHADKKYWKMCFEYMESVSKHNSGNKISSQQKQINKKGASFFTLPVATMVAVC